MADEEVVIDDAEMFQSAVEDAPVEQTKEERERDEKGRFVAKEAEPEPKTVEPAKTEATTETSTETPAEPDTGNVPSWRLREVREAREAAERRADEVTRERYALQNQMQAMQAELQALKTPKQEPVDFFADPDQALQQRMSPLEQKFMKLEQDMRLAASRTSAIAEHGAPAVQEMEKAIAEAMKSNHPDVPNLAMQMRSSDDPAGVAMQWFKRNKLWETTGGDPEAYKAKVLEEALKNPEFMAKALESARAQAGAPNSKSTIKLPPSLNQTAGSGQTASTDDGDMSDRGLFKHAMAGHR